MSKTADVELQTTNTEETEIDISVIVPFYNSEEHIEDCIKALLAQSYPSARYEILMVDNNSTDGSVEIIRKYPRINLLSESKQGSYVARNRGVAESKGSIIVFTDVDCVPSKDWLYKISEPLLLADAGLVQGGRLYAIDSSALSMLAAYEGERASYTFSGKHSGIYYGYTNNMAVRRELFNRCGPFLEIARGADSIFVNRIIEDYSGELIRYVPDASIRHLEIKSVWDYFRKRFIYGRSLQQNYSTRRGKHRKLVITEISAILNRTIHRKRYSLLQSLCLIILIFMGEFCFGFGRLSVRFKTLNKERD